MVVQEGMYSQQLTQNALVQLAQGSSEANTVALKAYVADQAVHAHRRLAGRKRKGRPDPSPISSSTGLPIASDDCSGEVTHRHLPVRLNNGTGLLKIIRMQVEDHNGLFKSPNDDGTKTDVCRGDASESNRSNDRCDNTKKKKSPVNPETARAIARRLHRQRLACIRKGLPLGSALPSIRRDDAAAPVASKLGKDPKSPKYRSAALDRMMHNMEGMRGNSIVQKPISRSLKPTKFGKSSRSTEAQPERALRGKSFTAIDLSLQY